MVDIGFHPSRHSDIIPNISTALPMDTPDDNYLMDCCNAIDTDQYM